MSKREVELNLDTLWTIFDDFKGSYMKNTPKKAKLIDSFCMFCLVLTGIQFLYVMIVGANMKNGLYAGLFTTFGSLILTSEFLFK